MKLQNTKNVALGVDPGIANCGWSVVARNRSGTFVLLDSGCIKTASSLGDGARLLIIYQHVAELLQVHMPTLVAVERVFHNKNVSSSISTGEVIGIVELAAAQNAIPVKMLTPQQVKKASGLTLKKADKTSMIRSMSRLFHVREDVLNSHRADVCAAGLVGLLHSVRLEIPPSKAAASATSQRTQDSVVAKSQS